MEPWIIWIVMFIMWAFFYGRGYVDLLQKKLDKRPLPMPIMPDPVPHIKTKAEYHAEEQQAWLNAYHALDHVNHADGTRHRADETCYLCERKANNVKPTTGKA